MFRLVLCLFYLLGSLSASIVLFVPLVLFLELLGLRAASETLKRVVTRIWGRYAVLCAGGKVRVHGKENFPASRNVCIIANHQEYADIVLMLGWMDRPVGFIAKQELGMVPMLATWMKFIHSLFLDRKSLRQGLLVIKIAALRMSRGQALVIFPEGTRSKGQPVSDFKAGSFKAPKIANSVIMPVTIDGSWIFLSKPGKVTPCRIDITIHPPIDTSALSAEDWKTLHTRVRDQIASKVRQVPALT